MEESVHAKMLDDGIFKSEDVTKSNLVSIWAATSASRGIVTGLMRTTLALDVTSTVETEES